LEALEAREKIGCIVQRCLEKSPCAVEALYGEPMAGRCSFRVGGPAQCLLRPSGEGFPAFAAALLAEARAEGVPVFPLGGGANIVVADGGIRGIVLDMGGWAGEDGISVPGGHGEPDAPRIIGGAEAHGGHGEPGAPRVIGGAEAPGGLGKPGAPRAIGGAEAPGGHGEPGEPRAIGGAADAQGSAALRLRAGTSLDGAAEAAAAAGLSGLEFFAGMPGSIGGAVWMNARCYGREASDALIEVEGIGYPDGEAPFRMSASPSQFGYKCSPFQGSRALILRAAFALEKGEPKAIRAKMDGYRRDREEKGHYRLPSAGSAFKNSSAFGKPTGKIIDELGLRGLRVGGAQVAPWHGNIIVNSGGATAADIRALTDEIIARVRQATGFELEPEILFV